MQVIINIPNEQLFEKIIWHLNSFESQGLAIVESSHDVSKENILRNLKLLSVTYQNLLIY